MTALYRLAGVVQAQCPIRRRRGFQSLEFTAKFQPPFGLPNSDGFH
jgi:hypothetical protein